MTLDFPDTLKLIKPQINLLQAEACFWDNSFQLYSVLGALNSDCAIC
jgi:hypothetical protein